MSGTIRIEQDERGVARLVLNRPEKHNALNGAMIDEITQAALSLGADDAVRVVVLAGEGKSFCAGGDLGWMKAQIEADSAQRASEARKLAEMLEALNALPKPLIGRIHGGAFGGGVGMACVCDVAIGAQGIKLGLTETRLGLIPATIGPHVVARMGEAMARRVFMSSRIFAADEAVTLGILARAVSASELDAVIEAEVTPYLTCAPQAVAEAKALTRTLGGQGTSAARDASIAALVARWESAEAREGVAAFLEKRKPDWA